MSMVKASINITADSTVLAAFPFLEGLHTALKAYGITIEGLTLDEEVEEPQDLSPVSSNLNNFPSSQDTTPDNLDNIPSSLLDNAQLKALQEVLEGVPSHNLYEERGIDYNASNCLAMRIPLNEELLNKLGKYRTYSEGDKANRNNKVVEVTSEIVTGYQLTGIRMQYGMTTSQATSFIRYVASEVGLELKGMELFHAHELVVTNDAFSMRTSDNAHLVLKSPVSTTQVEIPKRKLSLTH